MTTTLHGTAPEILRIPADIHAKALAANLVAEVRAHQPAGHEYSGYFTYTLSKVAIVAGAPDLISMVRGVVSSQERAWSAMREALDGLFPRAERLQCDHDRACRELVGHIDDSGYVYCLRHGLDRARMGHRTRLLSAAEAEHIMMGGTIAFDAPEGL